MEAGKEPERRMRTRVGFRGRVEVEAAGRAILVTDSQDVSLSGIFIRTEERLPLGAGCLVNIRLAEQSEEFCLHLQAKVTRQEPGGLGLRFLSMDPDSYFHLKNIVLYNSPDAEQAENEIVQPGF